MPAAQVIGFSNLDPGGLPAGVQRAICPANTLNANSLANSEYSEMGIREAGVFDRGYARIVTNTLDGPCTFTVQFSRADTSVVVMVGAAQTGTFENTAQSATAAAADELLWRMDSSGAGAGVLNATILALRFVPTDGAATITWAYCGGSGGGTNAASATRYSPITSTMAVSPTESDAQARIRGAFTSKSLYFEVASNARTTDTIVRTRVNGADGTQTVTVAGSQTGVFEDATHTDALADGDDYNYSWTTGTGTGTINSRACCTNLISASKKWVYAGGNVGGSPFDASLGARYTAIAGNFTAAEQTVEANAQVKTFAQSLSHLTGRVSANNASTAFAVRVRVNGADGNGVISIGSGQTGLFQDDTGLDVIAADDLVALKFDPTAGTGIIHFQILTLLGDTSPPPQPGAIVCNLQIG